MAVESRNKTLRRILVADDHPEMRTYVRRLLANLYDVELVSTGRAALEAARRVRPDLVLTDVIMPDMDGFALLRAIRSDPALRTVPAIVISEKSELDSRIEGLEAGADDYLAKPFSPLELLARVKASLELSRMREEVEHAAGREDALREEGKRKDEFLAMLAHELRNPLAPMTYAIHLLGVPGADAAALARIRAMLSRQVDHLARIVDDLLDVSRINNQKLSLARERLDLVQIVREAGDDRRNTLEAETISLDVNVPAVPIWVLGDATRLAQLLGNLLDNARKFTPSGGRVSVEVRRGAAGGQAEIAVRDSGIGIDAGFLGQIFQPFAQAEQSLDRRRGGLGLGLAVAKGLAELHGGTIEASSAGRGLGSEFIVRIPTESEPAAVTTTAMEAGAPHRSLRVLVVEDNEDAADMLRTLLEFNGFEVAVAHTGPEGVQAAKTSPPDVVVCDIGLPGMDGYAVAGALRQHPATARARLIAVTGYGREDDRRRALASGFDLHLVKPVDPNRLVAQLLVQGAS